MGVASDIPDGRPSELYLVKGRGGWKAEVLVDSHTKEVYCSIAPVMSVRGWSLSKLEGWIADKKGWSLTHVGPGINVTALKST
jgi:hypothetical protein